MDCACVKGNQECPVLKHNLEPTENLGSGGRRRGSRKDKETVRDDQGQNQNMGLDGEGKGKSVSDGKQRKLSPLRLSISNNQARPCFFEHDKKKKCTNLTLSLTPYCSWVTCLDFTIAYFFCYYTFTLVVHACSSFVKCFVHVFSIVTLSFYTSSWFPLLPMIPLFSHF